MFKLMWKRHAVAKATQLVAADFAAVQKQLLFYTGHQDRKIEAYWMEAA